MLIRYGLWTGGISGLGVPPWLKIGAAIQKNKIQSRGIDTGPTTIAALRPEQ